MGAVLGGIKVTAIPPPVVHQLELADRFIVRGDFVILRWKVEYADTITIWEGPCIKHKIDARAGQGSTPLLLKTAGWLDVEVANHWHTHRMRLGPLQILKIPAISWVNIPDPQLSRITNVQIDDLSGLLTRLGDRLPSWRTARPSGAQPPWRPEAHTQPIPTVNDQAPESDPERDTERPDNDE